MSNPGRSHLSITGPVLWSLVNALGQCHQNYRFRKARNFKKKNILPRFAIRLMILRSAVFEHIFPTKHVEYAFVQLSVIELIGSRTEIIITIVIIFNVSQ